MTINIPKLSWPKSPQFLWIIAAILSVLSIVSTVYFVRNGLSLAYNDARSHLNIGRRVVEGLNPSFAQIGSVWLPLPHILMIPTIWIDQFWHTGLSGTIPSMIAYVVTGIVLYKILENFKVGVVGKALALLLYAVNLNILYLQSTAMTELLLIATMTIASFKFIVWHQTSKLTDLFSVGFWVMLSTLIRYDGWFLFVVCIPLIFIHIWKKINFQAAEGLTVIFSTLAGFGIFLWFGWNLLIFKDPLYFALGPFSAHTQQQQFSSEGRLSTKGNLTLSVKSYAHAVAYNTYTLPAIVGIAGFWFLLLDTSLSSAVRRASITVLAPVGFNIIALYLGHSILFLPEFTPDATWFNVRYGVMAVPAIALGVGYAADRWRTGRWLIVGTMVMVTLFSLANRDAVVVDDGRSGKSTKNVTEVSNFLQTRASQEKGFILISTASHDAVVFSSGLPMNRFISEGTGIYWDLAVAVPEKWARWIVMRSQDDSDFLWKSVKTAPGLSAYNLVGHYPFADIYEIKPEFVGVLTIQPIYSKQH